MSRVEPLQTSFLDVYPLSSSTTHQALFVFAKLLASCAGPHGKNHIIRNSCGGHVTITSSCSRLLSTVSLSRSELKLIASALNGHLQQYMDCGLFMAHMCLQLTKSALDLDIHHSIVSSAFQSFVSVITEYITSNRSYVCVKADFSNVNILLAYIRSVLSSKALLNIQHQVLHELCLVILNAYVKAIPSVPVKRYSNGVFVLSQEKVPIKNCKTVEGIMLECPEFPAFIDSGNTILKTEINENDYTESFVKIALITCSLSGEMENSVSATYEATEQQFNDLENLVKEKIAKMCDALEKENVGVIACQKVIHPRIKTLIRSKSIIFIERLGSQPIPYIRDLTGCQPISSILQTKDIGACLGKLTSVIHCTENNKSFIHLRNRPASMMTLVVCAEWEERLSELKNCVNACLRGLQVLVKEPRLLMGGGCWQMHCSYILMKQVHSSLPEMSKKLSCPNSTVLQLLSIFRSCLHQWCLKLTSQEDHLSFDPSSLHCWRVSKNSPASITTEKWTKCCCGLRAIPWGDVKDLDVIIPHDEAVMRSQENRMLHSNAKNVNCDEFAVLDSFAASMDALHKGVLTAGLLLSIGQFISDKN